MPLTKIEFAPGLNKDDSPLASEGAWVDADKVRFVGGRAQTIGGWQAMTGDTFTGIARGAHAWTTLNGRRVIAWGTAAKLYAMVGGAIRDITPAHSEGVLTDPFTTAAGSSAVTVKNHPGHGFSSGMRVAYFNQSAAVGGLILVGSYTVSVIDDDSYTVDAGTNASSSATGGGNVDFSAILPEGLVNGTGEPGGYGTGPYGIGGYGLTAVTDMLPRVWFLDNWGETLVALPRGGGLYQFQPALDYSELVGNGGFDSPTGWTAGTGWSIGAGVATAVAGSASDLSAAVDVVPGYVYRVAVTVVRTAGTLTIRTDGGTLGAGSAAISTSGSYSRRVRVPAGSTKIVFAKDSAFAGSIDNVSIKLEERAYRVDEAPPRNAAMFVDPHQIVVLLGTNPYLGPYNPMAVRWCDRQDITAWVPTLSNLAGDDTLASGGRLVSGIATRQQNLLWSDTSLTTMQYTGDARMAFRFDLAGTGCGLIGALARVEHNGTVFWPGRGNFYIYGGAAPVPIPCKIERDVFDNLDQPEKMVCGILPGRSEVWFLYADRRDGTECSRYAALKMDEGHWTAGTFARSSWIKPGVFEFPIMFGTDGVVYEHETGHSANGGAISAFVEGAYLDIGDGENLMMVRRIVGDFEELAGAVDFTLYAKMWPTAAERKYGPFQHTPETRKLDCRVTGRQMKVRLDSESAPLFWRAGAIRADVVQLGARR